MTDDFHLPPELQLLERHLAARERPQLPYQGKQRLLCRVRAELSRSHARSRWAFAMAMAATVLVWLNLSLCATQATDCGLGLDGPHQSVKDPAQQIHELLPDLPPGEAMRQAVLLRAGGDVIPCARLSGGCVALRRNPLGAELMN
jgi:hypothetical protein